ncbi:hypothetical protein Tco_0604076 [Tanacetum coccineum]
MFDVRLQPYDWMLVLGLVRRKTGGCGCVSAAARLRSRMGDEEPGWSAVPIGCSVWSWMGDRAGGCFSVFVEGASGYFLSPVAARSRSGKEERSRAAARPGWAATQLEVVF